MVDIFLKEVAESQGRNLNYVVLHSGVSIGTVRAYWHKKANRVDLDVLDRLCALLNVEPGALIRRFQSTTATHSPSVIAERTSPADKPQ